MVNKSGKDYLFELFFEIGMMLEYKQWSQRKY